MFSSKTPSRKAIMLSTLLLVLLSILNSSSFIQYANAKEIEATNEWQLLEEGDTIPAGLHVRMDLETGKKWVKLMDEEEESSVTTIVNDSGNNDKGSNSNSNSDSSIALSSVDSNTGTEKDPSTATAKKESTTEDVKITHLLNTQVDPTKSAKITSQLLEQAQQESERQANLKQSIAALNDFDADTTIDELDYEMMYRTLMKLPDEERELLNVPLHPLENEKEGGGNELNEDEKKEQLNDFITKIKDIWNERQETLKQLEEEYLANVPDIIQERIATIKEYISSPVEHLKELFRQETQNGEGDEEEERTSMNIIEALEDLEFHLMDIDMARDFHIMGGWPLLVSLLTDEIHSFETILIEVSQQIMNQENVTKLDDGATTVTLPKEYEDFLYSIKELIWKIQSLASWSIGTAVKNIEEFHPWALEDMFEFSQQQQKPLSTSSEAPTINVVSILFKQIQNMNGQEADNFPTTAWLKLKQKQIYALGSLLRGNKYAMYYFDSVNGSSMLGDFFTKLTNEKQRLKNDVLDNTIAVKLLTKVLMLGVDLIKDATSIHSASGETNLNSDLVSKLSDDTWCSMPLKLLRNQSTLVQRQVIEAMIELSQYCDFDGDNVRKLVEDSELQDMIGTMLLNKKDEL